MWLPYHRRPSFAQKKSRRDSAENDRGGHRAIPGFLLDKPKTDLLHVENKIFHQIEIGHASMQGYRVSMEDEHIIDYLTAEKDHLLVAVMDGHAGTYAAKYTAKYFKRILQATSQWQEYIASKHKKDQVNLLATALATSYLSLDEELLEMAKSGLMVSSCSNISQIARDRY